MFLTLLRLLPLLLLGFALPAAAQTEPVAVEADEDVPLSPETLGDALSCRSHPAAVAFATALFLEGKPPKWMRAAGERKETEGMIGLFGYQLSQPVEMLGEPVSTVYFLKDWVVTLLPRSKATAFLAAQKMERAPIKVAEQYYRFVDPEAGPMLGAFEPTGGSMEVAFARAFGEKPPPSAPSDSLFIGCNYAPATEAEFLEMAAQSEAMLDEVAKGIAEAMGSAKPE